MDGFTVEALRVWTILRVRSLVVCWGHDWWFKSQREVITLASYSVGSINFFRLP